MFTILGVTLGSSILAEEPIDQSTFLGGPSSVGADLSADDAAEPKTLRGWQKRKMDLRENFGFDIGGDLAILAQRADNGESASSGVFRLYGRWTLTGRDTPETGSLVWKIENRTAFGDAPASLGPRLGYAGLTGTSFTDAGWFLAPFYWEQYLKRGSAAFVFGRLDPLDFVDLSGYSGQWTRFQNASLLVNSTIAFPDLGFGAGFGFKPNDQTVLGLTIHDANGNSGSVEWFPNGPEFFSQAYLSWSPDRTRRFDRAIHLTLWHLGEREDAGKPEDYGLAFSVNWMMDNGWMPFVRAGVSEGSVARADRSFTAGTLYRPENGVAEFGFALGWERLSDTTLGEQRAAEAFFRWDATDHIQITPSVQAIFDTPLSSGDSTKLVFGLRTRLTF
ncbi:MAG: carbohydrate porin [Tateyamaria sp.]|uniref:carbohydrate porin n=2 Tax=Tateyamaria sp. TaxID=1929288 RepID=UPI00326EC77A